MNDTYLALALKRQALRSKSTKPFSQATAIRPHLFTVALTDHERADILAAVAKIGLRSADAVSAFILDATDRRLLTLSRGGAK